MKTKKNHITQKSKPPNEIFLLAGFLTLILLHIIGGIWQSYYSWGFSYWSVFSQDVFWGISLLSILTLFVTYKYRSNIKFGFLEKVDVFQSSKLVTNIIYIVVSVLLFVLLYKFRSLSHIYGDGYLIIENALDVDDIFSEAKNYMEFLTIYLYYSATITISKFYDIGTEQAIAIINSLAGTIGIWGLWSIAKLISTKKNIAYFIFISSITSASLVLFFGYVENYTCVTVAGLWSLRFMLGYLRDRNGIVPIILCSTLSIAFHLLALPFFVVGIYSILLKSEKFDFLVNLKTRTLTLFVVIASVVVLFLTHVFELTMFVPIISNIDNTYSLISATHLIDLCNQLILASPIVIIFLFAFIGNKNDNKINQDNVHKCLYLLALLTFLTSCFIDPQLGAARDWDLLSLYGFPLTIYCAYQLVHYFNHDKFPNWIIVASCLIIIIHIMPNLYEKNNTNLSVVHLDKILWEDPHYQNEYNSAIRGLSWGHILRSSLKRTDLAQKYFVRRSLESTNDATPLYNLAIIHRENRRLDSVRYYLQKCMVLDPTEPNYYSMLSEIDTETKNFQSAEKYARKSLALDSNHIEGITSLAILLSHQQKTDEALIYFRKAYDLKPNDFKNVLNLGIQYAQGVNADSANFYLKEALKRAPEQQKSIILSALISVSLFLHKNNEAESYLKELKKVAPNSNLYYQKEKEIKSR